MIENGVMNITAVKDGIHANDYITLDGKNINITVNAQGDGIESEGYLTVDKATLNLSGGGKGLNAADYITLTSGTFDSNPEVPAVAGNKRLWGINLIYLQRKQGLSLLFLFGKNSRFVNSHKNHRCYSSKHTLD